MYVCMYACVYVSTYVIICRLICMDVSYLVHMHVRSRTPLQKKVLTSGCSHLGFFIELPPRTPKNTMLRSQVGSLVARKKINIVLWGRGVGVGGGIWAAVSRSERLALSPFICDPIPFFGGGGCRFWGGVPVRCNVTSTQTSWVAWLLQVSD